MPLWRDLNASRSGRLHARIAHQTGQERSAWNFFRFVRSPLDEHINPTGLTLNLCHYGLHRGVVGHVQVHRAHAIAMQRLQPLHAPSAAVYRVPPWLGGELLPHRSRPMRP